MNLIGSTHKINNIEIKEKIGEGNFGEVYIGKWNYATSVALKKLKSNNHIKEFISEFNILM